MQLRVKTYSELEKCVNTFNSERLEIMICEGDAGTGKSSMIRNSLRNTPENGYCWLTGRISAVCLYEKLYHHRDLPIFLDDVDGLYRDKECVNMLKCLAQTERDSIRTTITMKRGVSIHGSTRV